MKPPISRFSASRTLLVFVALAVRALAAAPAPIRPELASSREAVMDLEAGWANPPRIARTRCWWWWLNGNVTAEAITRDLEQMKAKGLGGANVIDAGGAEQRGNRQVPHGPDFASPEWRRLFVHALREADRLGLELGFNIQSGWNLGGPTVTPEQAAKRLTWSEIDVRGGEATAVGLPMPAVRDDFYRDAAVVAFPLPEQADRSVGYRLAASSGQESHPAEHAVDGDPATFWVSDGARAAQGPAPARPEWLEFRFDAPVEADRLTVIPRPGYGPKQCRLEVATGQDEPATLVEFSMEAEKPKTVDFAPTSADRFRLVIVDAFDPRFPDAPRNVQVAEWSLGAGGRNLTLPQTPAGRIDHYRQKAYDRYPGGFTATAAWHLLEAGPERTGDPACRSEEVVVLTDRLEEDGTLRWDAPPGRWRVLRFGYTLSGSEVSTHSEGGGGLAIDYLDRGAFDAYWQAVMEPILAEAAPYVGRSLQFLHTDSWELGPVNWTARMPEQFRRLRGYAIGRWLPALAGYVVDDRARSTRFLNDFRLTLADLIAEGKYGTFSEFAHRRGLGIHPESGGPHAAPIDALKCLGRNDVPMGEFWARSQTHRVEDWQRLFVKQPACAAHVYGRRLVLAEAFTTIGPQWERDPRDLKPVFDRVACEGLNLTMFHTFDCSPKEMGLPGQAYFAGTHVNPNVTWWDQAGAFVDYLNRCHFLLQQGLFVADVLYFYGENIPAFVRLKRDDPAGVLPGYDYDVINAEALLTRASVAEGRIVLPDGMSYRLLVLPDHDAIGHATLERIAELVEAGATVVGRRPQKPLGLPAAPDDDARFESLVDRLWGDGDAGPIAENRCGQGRVIWGKTARQVLEAEGVGPDFGYDAEREDALLDYIHRATDEAEIYFVANRNERWERADCRFRVVGRLPELWDPLSGETREARAFRQESGATVVPLEFPPNGSLLVVFRRAIARDAAGPARQNFAPCQETSRLPGPWTVAFDPAWGGPESVQFDDLVSWSERPEPGIRFYSGAAVYETRFDLAPAESKALAAGSRILLDLGEVKNVAEVRLNGRRLGVVWTLPFRVDLTDAVGPADNRLEIKVVNLWPNRLIGDEHLPPEERRTSTNITKFTKDSPLLPSGLLGPVAILTRAAERATPEPEARIDRR